MKTMIILLVLRTIKLVLILDSTHATLQNHDAAQSSRWKVRLVWSKERNTENSLVASPGSILVVLYCICSALEVCSIASTAQASVERNFRMWAHGSRLKLAIRQCPVSYNQVRSDAVFDPTTKDLQW